MPSGARAIPKTHRRAIIAEYGIDLPPYPGAYSTRVIIEEIAGITGGMIGYHPGSVRGHIQGIGRAGVIGIGDGSSITDAGSHYLKGSLRIGGGNGLEMPDHSQAGSTAPKGDPQTGRIGFL